MNDSTDAHSGSAMGGEAATVHPAHDTGRQSGGYQNGNGPQNDAGDHDGSPAQNGNGKSEGHHGVTAAQLRRFIKSRPYVPLHELRRRFELNGEADDVWPIQTPDGLLYLGLPERESELIGDLVRQGEIGVELCRDPAAPMVVGVFAMRPISRP